MKSVVKINEVDDNGIYVHKELNAEEIVSDDNENYRLCNNFPNII